MLRTATDACGGRSLISRPTLKKVHEIGNMQSNETTMLAFAGTVREFGPNDT